MKELRIEVPATSANLGPGFDTLGLALDLVDTFRIHIDDGSDDVVLHEIGGDDTHPLDPRDNLICRAYTAFARDAHVRLPGVRFSVESRIPMGKGLGSSAAAIVAGLSAAAHLSGEKDTLERQLNLAVMMEGHADNAVAALIGGLTVGFIDGKTVRAIHVANHLSLGIAVFVPVDALPTREARSVLPDKIPRSDAIFNLGRLAYLTSALIWGRWELIGPAMEDRLHQPHRLSLIPALDDVIVAAREAGAYGAALSGGGPSVIALGPVDRVRCIATAMEEVANTRGWKGRSIVTRVRQFGAQVKEEGGDSAPQ